MSSIKLSLSQSDHIKRFLLYAIKFMVQQTIFQFLPFTDFTDFTGKFHFIYHFTGKFKSR
jgi:hypothetical protein